MRFVLRWNRCHWPGVRPSMKVLWSLLACSLLLGVVSAPSAADAPSALLGRMAAINPGLESFTAHISSTVDVLNIPFMHPQLDGTFYHKHPSMNKIVITSGLPGIAKQFSKLYPQVPSPSQWPSLYEISFAGDVAGVTSLRLIPRKHGRIDHIDVKVDDSHATVTEMRWNYIDGGYARLTQKFALLDGHRVVVAQNGHVEVPLYKADIVTTLSGYVWNPSIPDSFFGDGK